MTKEFDASKIDWNKAPEDATHWVQDLNPTEYDKYSGWARFDGFVYKSFDGGFWKGESTGFKYIQRPSESITWDGIGKLKVGMICEAWYSAQKGWQESEVLKTDFDEYGVPIIAVRDVETNYLFWAHDFRPLKSQEQIEREEAFEEMYKDLEGCISAKEISKYLISKGWRKSHA